MRRQRHAGLRLRRAGGTPAGGLRPDHPGLQPPVRPGGRGGAGQAHDPVGGSQRGATGDEHPARLLSRISARRDRGAGAQAERGSLGKLRRFPALPALPASSKRG